MRAYGKCGPTGVRRATSARVSLAFVDAEQVDPRSSSRWRWGRGKGGGWNRPRRARRVEPATTDRVGHGDGSWPRRIESAAADRVGDGDGSWPRRIESATTDRVDRGRRSPSRRLELRATPNALSGSTRRGRLHLSWRAPPVVAGSTRRGRLHSSWRAPPVVAGSIHPGPRIVRRRAGPSFRPWASSEGPGGAAVPRSRRRSSCRRLAGVSISRSRSTPRRTPRRRTTCGCRGRRQSVASRTSRCTGWWPTEQSWRHRATLRPRGPSPGPWQRPPGRMLRSESA